MKSTLTLLSELFKEIHIYPEGESDYPLKSIKFAFPILLNGKEVDEIFLNKPSSVETLVVLQRKWAKKRVFLSKKCPFLQGQT